MKDFKIDDRVRDISVTRRFGTITSVNHYGDPDCLVVRFDDDEEGVCYVKDLEIFPDPKTAFLTELQALMRRYNATIDVDGDECFLCLIIDIDGHTIEYTGYDYFTGKEKQTALTPDNIFNYDKE